MPLKDRQKYLKYQREYAHKHKERKREYKIQWYKKQIKIDPNYNKKRFQKQKLTQRKYQKRRKDIDINFKISGNLRTRLYQSLKKNSKSKKTLELLGCTISKLKIYLQKRFKVGMTWENYGRGKGKWNIDHIRPCVSFDLSKSKEQKKCFNYKNLQPLWHIENKRKGENYG